MPTRLPNPEIDAALEVIDDWQRSGKVLQATFVFDSFGDAIEFMIEVAEQADLRQHHPDWRNLYNKVSIELTTQDLGGVTDMDLEFALLISQIAKSRRQSR